MPALWWLYLGVGTPSRAALITVTPFLTIFVVLNAEAEAGFLGVCGSVGQGQGYDKNS